MRTLFQGPVTPVVPQVHWHCDGCGHPNKAGVNRCALCLRSRFHQFGNHLPLRGEWLKRFILGAVVLLTLAALLAFGGFVVSGQRAGW